MTTQCFIYTTFGVFRTRNIHVFMYSFTVLFLWRRKWLCNVSFTLPLVFLERGIFICLCPVLFHSAFVIIVCERIDNVGPPGLLLLMRYDFPIDNIHVSRSIRRIERIGRIDNDGPPGLLSLMRCDFPIDNIQVSGRVHSTNRSNRSIRQALYPANS